MGSKVFFKEQKGQSSEISHKVNGDDKESYIAPNLETCNEAFEKDCLKTEISNVQTKALQEEPYMYRDGQFLKVGGDEGQCTHTCR